MLSIKKLAVAAILLSILGLTAGYGLVAFKINQPLRISGEQIIYVESGSSLYQLSAELQKNEIIEQALWVKLYSRIHPEMTSIHVGEYRVNETDTLLDLLKKISKGQVVSYKFTLVEGWTFKQALEHVAKQEKLHFDLSLNPVVASQQLSIDGHFEGQIYPATYEYVKGQKASDILRFAHDKLERVLSEEWALYQQNLKSGQNKLPYKNPYEALIMASIIEKETGQASERPQISGVFVRRLNKGMRLQTDPTVIYGMGDRYDGNIRKRDLQIKTPYNTYRINGLPPTPIALVGREAINATFNPDNSDKLYFVAKGDGSHYFSSTIEEHNRAVRKYQIFKRKKEYRSAPSESN